MSLYIEEKLKEKPGLFPGIIFGSIITIILLIYVYNKKDSPLAVFIRDKAYNSIHPSIESQGNFIKEIMMTMSSINEYSHNLKSTKYKKEITLLDFNNKDRDALRFVSFINSINKKYYSDNFGYDEDFHVIMNELMDSYTKIQKAYRKDNGLRLYSRQGNPGRFHELTNH